MNNNDEVRAFVAVSHLYHGLSPRARSAVEELRENGDNMRTLCLSMNETILDLKKRICSIREQCTPHRTGLSLSTVTSSGTSISTAKFSPQRCSLWMKKIHDPDWMFECVDNDSMKLVEVGIEDFVSVVTVFPCNMSPPQFDFVPANNPHTVSGRRELTKVLWSESIACMKPDSSQNEDADTSRNVSVQQNLLVFENEYVEPQLVRASWNVG